MVLSAVLKHPRPSVYSYVIVYSPLDSPFAFVLNTPCVLIADASPVIDQLPLPLPFDVPLPSSPGVAVTSTFIEPSV